MNNRKPLYVTILAVLLIIPMIPNGGSSGTSEIASNPSACATGYVVNQVNESASGVIGYNCVVNGSGTSEVASTPPICATHYIVNQVNESSSGVIAYHCIRLSYSDLTGIPPINNETASNPTGCTINTQAVYKVNETSNGTLNNYCETLSTPPSISVFSENNANTCTDSTALTNKMMGFALYYTTHGTGYAHNLTLTLNFGIKSATTSNVYTLFTWVYGTGTAPSCNAAAVGTAIGRSYAITSSSTVAASHSISLTYVINSLSANTRYWFDIASLDQSTANWVYATPQITVIET
jgi:hypothetical protein